MEPLISVIVPIYGIERYVGLCIESILNQTYKNLEIILVDDGGRDRCPEICDLYSKKDKRIKVIHKSNGGLVSARKAGLQESNGSYISYVDGDDWIGPGFIDSLYSSIKMAEADVACAGFSRDLFSQSSQFTDLLSARVYEGEELRSLWQDMLSRGAFYRNGISTYLWNKLFKREIILAHQMTVDNRITIGEDGATTYPALLGSKRIVVTENTAYHYRQREDSMLKQSSRYVDEAVKIKYLYEYMKNWSKKCENSTLHLHAQVIDYVLSIAIMRSGGRLPQGGYSAFGESYYDKNVAVYGAGTFGQQLMNRLKESKHCNAVAWIDDDYWEYRRCCLDVDPVESVTKISFDYILVATVNSDLSKKIVKKLTDLGVSKGKLLTVSVPEESGREQLLEKFLDIKTLREIDEKNRKREILSHA